MNKSLANLNRKTREKTQMIDITNERKDNISDPINIKRIVK